MSQSSVDLLTATILSGATTSNAILTSQIGDSAAIGILSPAALDGGHSYVIEVNAAKDASGNWTTLKDRDGNTAYVPAADCAAWYPELPSFPAFRIRDVTGNAGADRAFTIVKHHTR